MAGVEHCIRREGEKQLVTKFLHDVKERTSANAFSHPGFGKTLTAGESQQLNDENVEEKRGEILEWFRRNEEGREWIKLLNGRQIRNILFSMTSLDITGDKRLKLDDVKNLTKATYLFRRAEATKD
ncbi:hypothetical protein I7I51_08324 [Histoplasma capsulatum]|uniref:Uncharacterized protein n=1 Tax=Ajellomyces capsulatus TaxID=5037 RepID=A0A8A1M2J4_AJECA|nr:hypothetical protein I7I51_08324 [Histoplasma capsulatum]